MKVTSTFIDIDYSELKSSPFKFINIFTIWRDTASS